MIGGATEPRSRQRLFITMAVSRYRHLPEDAQLGTPSADAERISDLLSAFGYQQALPGMGNYWTAEHVRSSWSGWSKDAGVEPDDVLIFYFAGHGASNRAMEASADSKVPPEAIRPASASQ